MNDLSHFIAGSGGGKSSSSSHTPTEYPDTLQSKETISFLELLGEGMIGGIVNNNSLQNVFFDGTQVLNADNSANYFLSAFDVRLGTQNQPPISGFSDIETPYSVNVRVRHDTPHTISISNPNTNHVRIIMTIPSLMMTNAQNGDTTGGTVQYKFSVSTNGGAYQYVNSGRHWLNAGTISGTTATGATGCAGVRVSVSQSFVQATSGDALAAYTSKLALENQNGFGNDENPIVGESTFQPQGWNGATWVNIGAPCTFPYNSSLAPLTEADNATMVIDGSGYSQLRLTSIASNVTCASTAGQFGSLVLTLTDVQSDMPEPNVTLIGKSRAKYQREHLIPLPTGSSWLIKVERVTADSISALTSDETWLDSYVEVIDSKLSYPNSALVAISMDAQQFSSIPSRAYLVDGLYIKVPSNYNATSRAYTGIWNGTFTVAVSNNPAWVLYDLLTNTRYGLGKYIAPSQVDASMLYVIGKYCDVMVDDGYGGTEPRFTINTAIQEQADAYKLVGDICSAFQGMGFWNGSTVSFTQDSPTDPVMAFSQANVIDGLFSYTGTARKDRNSVVMVTWNDPSQQYKQQIEYVESQSMIQRYGYRTAEMVAFGCTSRGQAHRAGKWVLLTQEHESDVVSFKVGLDSAMLLPGDIVKVNDVYRAGKRMGGRLVACTTTSATLDAPTVLNQSGAILSLRLADGTLVDRTINQSPGTYSVLTWATALPSLPVVNAMWVLAEPSLVSQLFRVISITQEGATPNAFSVTAVQHNPLKRASVESNVELEDAPTSLFTTKVATPTNLIATKTIIGSGSVKSINAHISWNGTGRFYDLSYRQITPAVSNWTTTRLSITSFDYTDVPLGEWEIAVVAINSIGVASKPARTVFVSSYWTDDAWLPTPINPTIWCTQDEDGVISKARVSVEFPNGLNCPVDGFVIMASVSKTPNTLVIESGGTGSDLTIASVSVLSSGSITLLAGSTQNKAVTTTLVSPLDTSINLGGRYWAKTPTSGGWKKCTGIDETGYLFAAGFDAAPTAGMTMDFVEVSWYDERVGEYKMGAIIGPSGYEVVRWSSISQHVDGKMHIENCERGLEGTTVMDAAGKTFVYYPAPGQGTTILNFPSSSFTQSGNTFQATGDISLQIPAGYSVSITAAIYAVDSGGAIIARSNVVPAIYGGPMV